MAENKKGFVLYADLLHTVTKLPDDKAGILFKIILEYVNDNSPCVDDLIIDVVFEPIKRQLKRDLQKYEAKKIQWSKAGKRSAELRKAKKKQRTLTNVESRSTDSTVTVTDTDTDTVINNMFDFNSFWDLYDKKRSAKKCREKWKRLKDQERSNIMSHVPGYVKSTPNKQLRKDPITYLNNESWNDEIIFIEKETFRNANGSYNLGI